MISVWREREKKALHNIFKRVMVDTESWENASGGEESLRLQ